MKALSVEEIRRAVSGRWMAQPVRPTTVCGVATDTRTAQAGELFVAIRGQRFDGHDFLAQAVAAGCPACIIEHHYRPDAEMLRSFPAGIIGVRETVGALGALAAYHRSVTPAAVVAVTGSNGKTTVKRMIHHILSGRLKGLCSPQSYNNEIGVPLSLLAARASDDYVVCEIGTNAPGEVERLGKLARPSTAVIASVGPAHLARLRSVEHVAVEKASLLGCLPADGLGVVWADSDELMIAARIYHRRVVSFGESDAAEFRLTGYEPLGRGQRFVVNGYLKVELPLPGRHNAMNAMGAMMAAQRFGITPQQAGAALANFVGMEMRLQWIDAGGVTILGDCYNANPASLAAATEVLGSSAGRRKVLVAGDMRELGERSEELHLQAGRAAARRVDLVIGVGALGRLIAAGAAEAGAAAEVFDSTEAALGPVPGLLAEGDVVLIKGSRAMEMERLVEPICKAFTPGRKVPARGPARSEPRRARKKAKKKGTDGKACR